jgi:hypothetical protein
VNCDIDPDYQLNQYHSALPHTHYDSVVSMHSQPRPFHVVYDQISILHNSQHQFDSRRQRVVK